MRKFGNINMSRIGKKIIAIPAGVTVTVTGQTVVVKGTHGELSREIHAAFSARVEDGKVTIVPVKEIKKISALWGLTRSLVANMVQGVSVGYSKKLIFEGVGYRAVAEAGRALVMQLGFSHPVRFEAPMGVALSVEKNTITIAGADKELVGRVSASIRDLKPPEPYKGKGIRYSNEVIRRKAGKKAVASAG